MAKKHSNNSIDKTKQKDYPSFPFANFPKILPQNNTQTGESTANSKNRPAFDCADYHYTRIGFGAKDKLQVIQAEAFESLEEVLGEMFDKKLSLEDISQILKILSEKSLRPSGIGAFKKVYNYGDLSFLIEDAGVESNSGSILYSTEARQIKSKLLKSIGIATPQIIEKTKLLKSKIPESKDKTLAIEVQERAKGFPIQTFRLDAMCLMLLNNGIFFSAETITRADMNRICDAYQLCITKQRALTGQRHLSKFLDDALVLEILKQEIDFHGENIFFHPETGYTFLDLPLKQMVDFKCTDDAIYKINKSITNGVSCNTFLPIFEDIFDHALCLGSNFEKTRKSIADHFPLYVYNGLILEQTRKYLCGENPNETPPISLKGSDFFETSEVIQYDLFAMPFDEIVELKNALDSGDEALQGIREKYGLSKYFDFSCELGKRDFLEAFDCTQSCQDSTREEYKDIKFVQNWFSGDSEAVDFQL